MKISVIFGSPTPNGATAALLKSFLSKVPDSAEVSVFSAYEISPAPCDACGYCRSGGQCRYSELDELFSSVCDSDVIVIATPIYFFSFPAPLKAIIDRTQRFFNGNPEAYRPKKAVVLCTGGAPHADAQIILQQLRWVLPYFNASVYDTVVMNNTDLSGISSEVLTKAAEAAEGLFR